MKKSGLAVFVVVALLFFVSGTHASYPYAGVCPNGGVVFSDDYYDSSKSFWVDTWRFGQCECVSYVAWKLNQFTEVTHELFSNSYQGEHWGNAYNWKSLVDDEIYAHFSRNPEYLSESSSSYPWKSYGNGGVFDVRYAVAWWNSSSSMPLGHIAFVDSISWNSDGTIHHINISEYNFSTGHGPGTRALYPGNSDYPSYNNNGGFLYFITDAFQECDLQGTCTGSGGGGGGGGGPLEVPDFIVNSLWLENQSGDTKTVFKPGEQIKIRTKIKNVGEDSPSGITVKFYLSNGYNVDENKEHIETAVIDDGDLESGEMKSETEYHDAPSTPGTYNITVCADTQEEVEEEHESNNCSDEAVFRVDDLSWLTPIINLIMQ